MPALRAFFNDPAHDAIIFQGMRAPDAAAAVLALIELYENLALAKAEPVAPANIATVLRLLPMPRPGLPLAVRAIQPGRAPDRK